MIKAVSKIGFIALGLCLFALGACHKKKPDYPSTPSISFLNMQRNSDGTAMLKFHFTDGDADLGNSTDEGPNFFMTMYWDSSSVWVPTAVKSTYVIPKMDVGNNRAYEGEIRITLYP